MTGAPTVKPLSGAGGNANMAAPDGGACVEGVFCIDKSPDSDDCGSLALEPDTKMVLMPGNALMIFDRSGSMADNWNGMTRWQAAGGAMTTALMPIQDQLTIGAVFFPSDQGLLSCIVAPITDATQQIPFQPGPMALNVMRMGPAGLPMYQPGLGMTPTLEGLQAADAALQGATLTGTTVVILITDGDPNCQWNQQTAIDIVTAWAAKGIKTYVLGVPGVGGAGVATLNLVAMAGGTMQYIAASDPMMLQMKINEIVSQTVTVGIDSCSIELMPPATVPDKLHLVVTEGGVKQEVPHMLAADAGWTISADGAHVELTGRLCEDAKTGRFGTLKFEYGCVDAPPLPPRPPIE